MKPSQASVVLTGAAGGIGAAVARQLIEKGARVLLVGRTAAPLLALASELSAGVSDRSRLDALVVDITTASGVDALVHAAQARQVNVLINNAGAACFGPVDDASMIEADVLTRTNLLAPMQISARLLPHLLAQPKAHIINVGSTLGSIGIPGFAIYGATKAGLRAFSESLRRELAGSPVCVQYLAPRSVDTPFNDARTRAFNTMTGSTSDNPTTVANALLALLRSERAESYLGFFEHISARLNGLCPRVLDGAFKKHRDALYTLHADPARAPIKETLR